MRAASADEDDGAHERGGIDRLRDVELEPGPNGAVAILRAGVRGERHGREPFESQGLGMDHGEGAAKGYGGLLQRFANGR